MDQFFGVGKLWWPNMGPGKLWSPNMRPMLAIIDIFRGIHGLYMIFGDYLTNN